MKRFIILLCFTILLIPFISFADKEVINQQETIINEKINDMQDEFTETSPVNNMEVAISPGDILESIIIDTYNIYETSLKCSNLIDNSFYTINSNIYELGQEFSNQSIVYLTIGDINRQTYPYTLHKKEVGISPNDNTVNSYNIRKSKFLFDI